MVRYLTLGCLLAAFLATQSDSFAAAPRRSKAYRLVPQVVAGSVSRVELALEVDGENQIVDDNKVQRSKMSILANVTYDERLLTAGIAAGQPVRSVRQYDKAAVLLKLGEQHELRPTLREDRHLVGVELVPPAVTLFSPDGPLTRDELDVLEMHGSGMSLMAYLLLPDKPVTVEQSWKHGPELMAAMLDLDAVSETDVTSVLRQVVGDTAEVETGGSVTGAIGGVGTQIELKAKTHFNLTTGRIVWFGMVLRENRAIGHVEGGLEAMSKLQLKLTPVDDVPALTSTALAGLTLTPAAAVTLLSYDSPDGGWGLVHDRKWFITRDEDRLAILRRVDQGEFVAQCNVQTLDNAKSGERIPLSEFQDDIRKGLGDNFKEFVQASERSAEPDLSVYRVVALGEVEQLPIEWIYYLVASKQGRQVVLVFTIETSLLEKFGAADEELVASLRLDSPKESPKPTPAKPRE